MKKIMIALAAISMAVAAHAASAPWKATITNIYTGNSTDKFAGSVYIMDAALYSMEDVYNNFAKSEGAWTAATLGTSAAATITAANGAAANKTFEYGTGGSNYDFYAVVVNGDNLYFSNLLEDKAASTSATATTLAFGTQATGSKLPATAGFQGAGAWSAVAVPEPTSGLLMLVGLAGLALRRRRA